MQPSNDEQTTPWLYQLWQETLKYPGGRWLFSRFLAWKIPYSGSLRAQVRRLEPGYCLLQVKDRPALRNHLGSIHALALANAGELCSGLALHTMLPNRLRGIPVEIHTQYLQKARGTLRAHGRLMDPLPESEGEIRVEGKIENNEGKIVAITIVKWTIAPRPDRTA